MNKNAKNLIGMSFGRLTIIDRDYTKNSDRGIYWICKCSCGNIKSIRSRSMTIGITQSCGCYNRDQVIARQTLPNNQGAFNKLYATYIHNANRRNYLFDIPQIEFQKLVIQNCHYCNTEPNQNYRNTGAKDIRSIAKYNGLDRIDNTKGYTIDNVVPCCGICNRAKDVMSYQEFLEWVDRIHKHKNL